MTTIIATGGSSPKARAIGKPSTHDANVEKTPMPTSETMPFLASAVSGWRPIPNMSRRIARFAMSLTAVAPSSRRSTTGAMSAPAMRYPGITDKRRRCRTSVTTVAVASTTSQTVRFCVPSAETASVWRPDVTVRA